MSNVVRLPTASKRMVRQPSGAAGRAAVLAFRDASPWPGEHKWPGERAMERAAAQQAEGLTQLMTGTPDRLMVIAIFAALDEATQARVLRSLAPGAVSGAPTFQVAIDTLKSALPVMERERARFERIAGIDRQCDDGDSAA